MDVASFMTGNAGVILALLALAACIVWLVFPFIAMAKLQEIREEVERGNRYLAEISSRNAQRDELAQRPYVRIASVPRVVPTVRAMPSAKVMSSSGVIEPPRVVPLKVSKSGRELCLKETSSIKVMLKNGELTLEDRYYDAETNQWVALCCHPEFNE